MLWELKDSGGNGSTGPLDYIAGLHPPYYSYKYGFPN